MKEYVIKLNESDLKSLDIPDSNFNLVVNKILGQGEEQGYFIHEDTVRTMKDIRERANDI